MERQQGSNDDHERTAQEEKHRSQMERGRTDSTRLVRTDARNGPRKGNEVPGNNDQMREIKQEHESDEDYDAAADLIHFREVSRVANPDEVYPYIPEAPRDIKEEPAEAREVPEQFPSVDYENNLSLVQLYNNSFEGQVVTDSATIVDEVKHVSIGWLKMRAANASHISFGFQYKLPSVLREEKHGHWQGASYENFKNFVDTKCDRLSGVYIFCTDSATRASLEAVIELFKRPGIEIKVKIGTDHTDKRPHEPQMYYSMIDKLEIDDHLSRNTVKSILGNKNLETVQLKCSNYFNAEHFLEEWKKGERCIKEWKIKYAYTIAEKDSLPTEKTILKNQDGSKELLIEKRTFHHEKKVMVSFSEHSCSPRPANVLPPSISPRVAVSIDELRNLLQAAEHQTRETTAAQYIGVLTKLIKELIHEIQTQADQIDTLRANQDPNRVRPNPDLQQNLNHFQNILHHVNQFPAGFNFPGLD